MTVSISVTAYHPNHSDTNPVENITNPLVYQHAADLVAALRALGLNVSGYVSGPNGLSLSL